MCSTVSVWKRKEGVVAGWKVREASGGRVGGVRGKKVQEGC